MRAVEQVLVQVLVLVLVLVLVPVLVPVLVLVLAPVLELARVQVYDHVHVKVRVVPWVLATTVTPHSMGDGCCHGCGHCRRLGRPRRPTPIAAAPWSRKGNGSATPRP